jgi:hypothetical protein
VKTGGETGTETGAQGRVGTQLRGWQGSCMLLGGWAGREGGRLEWEAQTFIMIKGLS